jgi:uncharacterized cupin superfamily protein
MIEPEAKVKPKESRMAKRIDIAGLVAKVGSGYPPPHDAACKARERKRLGDAAGLTQFGVNLLRLMPGVWSSQRHWHTHEDEFVFVVSGEVVLVTDAGEEVLHAGDCAGFKAGEPNGHCLQNRSQADAMALEVGSRIEADACDYSDLDLLAPGHGRPYTRRDGTPIG